MSIERKERKYMAIGEQMKNKAQQRESCPPGLVMLGK